MIASRVSRLLATAIAGLSLSACGYDCGIASRYLADGAVRDAAGATLATVQVDLAEYVAPSFLRLSVGVMGASSSGGAPLRGHVTRARLETESGELLAEIPTATTTLPGDGVVALNLNLPSRSEFDRVRSALLTGRTRVVLDTDLAGRERLETVLSNAREVPGTLQECRFSPA